jgi:hypothetical protein
MKFMLVINNKVNKKILFKDTNPTYLFYSLLVTIKAQMQILVK